MSKQLNINIMNEVKVVSVTPNELVELINNGIQEKLENYIIPKVIRELKNKSSIEENPHLTKREVAKFFDVSVNCITDWTNQGKLRSFKMGQRVYYSKKECIDRLFKNEIK